MDTKKISQLFERWLRTAGKLMTREAAIATVVVVAVAYAWYWQSLPKPAQTGAESLLPAAATELPNTEEPAEFVPSKSVSSEADIRTAGSLAIPKLGIAAPLVYVDRVDEAAFQEGLEGGVVHYPGTANPGQPGNMFVFGHSSDYRYRAGDYKIVFAKLPQLEAGDEVVVVDAAGTKFVYTVTGGQVVAATATQYLSQDTEGKSLLTLQTSYPIGTALKRYLVLAELKE